MISNHEFASILKYQSIALVLLGANQNLETCYCTWFKRMIVSTAACLILQKKKAIPVKTV